MASLQKITYIRWVDAQGRRVSRTTPGAIRVFEKSSKWYACWNENGKQVRIPLATDKTASQAMFADLLRTRDRKAAGLIDPHQSHLSRPIREHIDEYLTTIQASGKVQSEKYFSEKRRILNSFVKSTGMRVLADLTGEATNAYLTRLKSSAGTKRVHHTAVNAFADWLVRMKRIAANPINGVARPQRGKVVHKRRALRPDELQRLLDAARSRPLASAETNHGGRSGDRKPRAAKLRDRTIARLRRVGEGRALLYKTAIFTGLRKGELAAIKVAHLDLQRKPYPCILLPGEFTKNGEDARLLLVPALATELLEWIDGKRPNDLVFDVPAQITPILRRDLKRAGIAYKDETGCYADFHSLRKSAGTMLGLAGVPTRVRQLFMRHSDVRLTLQTYDDAAFAELEEAVRAMERLGLN